jgi:hypothetical protein
MTKLRLIDEIIEQLFGIGPPRRHATGAQIVRGDLVPEPTHEGCLLLEYARTTVVCALAKRGDNAR